MMKVEKVEGLEKIKATPVSQCFNHGANVS